MPEVRSTGEALSDGELLARSRGGDHGAFGLLYERRRELVLAFLIKRTHDREVASDLTAETFAAALVALTDRPPEISGSAAPWLLTIARNRLIDSYRHGRVESATRRRLAFEPAQASESDIERVVRLAGESELLASLARELPADQYEALQARVLDERGYDEIARELDCSQAVVRKRVSRAISTLRAQPLAALAGVVLGALVLAAAAFAATQIIGVGAPVRGSGEQRRTTASTGVGLPVPGAHSRHGAARLLGVSVPDPAGGLPWGMRIVRTTRGLVCVQIGRLLGGRLGVLGQDGLFGDDGLFHELPASVLDQDTCDQPTHFTVYDARALAASAMLPGPQVSCWYPGSVRPAGESQPFCPASDERDVAFGVLGPHAVSVTYRVPGGALRTIPVTSGYGAYLIVLRQPPLSQPLNGSLSSSSFPLDRFPFDYQPSVLTSIRFRFAGHICQTGNEPLPGGPPACTSPRAGAPAPAGSHVAPALHTTITLKAHRAPHGYDLELAFAAPVAVRNASTAYGVEQFPPQTRGCGGLGSSGLPIERDVARGQVIHVTLFVEQRPGCDGVVRGRVIFGHQPGPLTGPFPEQTVGSFSFKLP